MSKKFNYEQVNEYVKAAVLYHIPNPNMALGLYGESVEDIVQDILVHHWTKSNIIAKQHHCEATSLLIISTNVGANFSVTPHPPSKTVPLPPLGKAYFTFIPFLVRAIRCFLISTSLIFTSITSPVLKSSDGCLMYLSLILKAFSCGRRGTAPRRGG